MTSIKLFMYIYQEFNYDNKKIKNLTTVVIHIHLLIYSSSFDFLFIIIIIIYETSFDFMYLGKCHITKYLKQKLILHV